MRCCTLLQLVGHVTKVSARFGLHSGRARFSLKLAVCECDYHTKCNAGAATWPRDLLSSSLRLAFQNLLQEEDSSVRDASQQFWQRLLQQLTPTVIAEALPAHIIQVQICAMVARCCRSCICKLNTTSSWCAAAGECIVTWTSSALLQGMFDLVCTPEGQALNTAQMLVFQPSQAQAGRSKAALSGTDRDMTPPVVGMMHDTTAIQLRVMGAHALGQLTAALQSHAGAHFY